jgi:hypothetical protein
LTPDDVKFAIDWLIEAKYPLDAFKIVKAYSEKLQLDLKPFPTLSLGG